MSLFNNIASRIDQQVSPIVHSKLGETLSREAGRIARDARKLFGKLAPNGIADALSSHPKGIKGVFDKPPVQLMGGISLRRAKQIFDSFSNIEHARKNLFYISIANVTPLNLPFESLSAVAGNISNGLSTESIANTAGMALPFLNWSNFDFNMFATEVSYSPVQLNSNTIHIGGASMSLLEGRELVEMRVTTLDDAEGSIKRWFRNKSEVMVFKGGTLGLPITYLLKVRVLHSYVEENAMNAENGYYDEFIMKAASIDTDLSRRDDGMQEIHLTFVQFDNFTNLV